ncbi:thiamine ABC transporter substrate binding subunit [Halovenus rubra]|uniref:Thiamine ABC transporter substrate binding subunit n=2 Tax=Halovenus rubra TaxID=869890 RepID=A0ABD5X8S1_9EURY|nr:thiamine ABC transporter substrate-binding protein [Halovenus rubra]
MRRRRVLTALGTGAVAAVAGCIGDGDDSEDGGDNGTPESSETATPEATPEDNETATPEGTDEETEDSGSTTDGEAPTLTIGTYSAFLDAPSISPGGWLKEQFESEYDATIEWEAPENEINHYIERQSQGVSIDADLYVGINTDELVRIDEKLDDSLFIEAGEIPGSDNIRDGLSFDPSGRALPFDTGYVSPVYDSTQMEAPETFEGLLDEKYKGSLIAQNPGTSTTGRAFLLHTIDHFGEDSYLDFWSDLQDNGVQILGSWSDAYTAWEEGEAPMVVSYSTDQVFAEQAGDDLAKHQIQFLNDEGYANPEGMTIFNGADDPGLAREFMSFVLQPDIQGEIAKQNVAFPATDDATLPDGYNKLAKEPSNPVTLSYEQLQGSLEDWIEAWERQFISN